jgi:hypothetical protein
MNIRSEPPTSPKTVLVASLAIHLLAHSLGQIRSSQDGIYEFERNILCIPDGCNIFTNVFGKDNLKPIPAGQPDCDLGEV